jgi:multiple sugar transport system substrate-binding protein
MTAIERGGVALVGRRWPRPPPGTSSIPIRARTAALPAITWRRSLACGRKHRHRKENNMKARTLLAVAAVLTFGATAACGGGGGGTKASSDAVKARGPISLWYSNNAQEVAWGKQVVAAWNSAHPTETVSAQEIPAGQTSEAVIAASITAGNAPCLIYNTAPAAVPNFQAQGGLVPLDDFADGASYIRSRTGSAADQYKSPDGKFYQMPWKANPVMIFYNKKEFAKAGLSTTEPALNSYAEFLDTAKKLVSSGAAKFAIYPSPSSQFFQPWFDFYPMYVAESGGKQLVENKKATFDSDPGRAVAGFWRQLYAQNLAGQETYNGDSFADGTAAMASVGPWAIATYKDKVDWGVVSVPTRAGGSGDQASTFSDAKNVAIYTACKNRGTAWDFLKFSTSTEQDGKLLEMTGQMPLRQNLEQQYAAYFAANPQYKTFAAKTGHVVEVPNIPTSVEVWQTFRDAWSKSVIFGKEDPNQALHEAAAKINSLVK